jgi:polyphosphate kinase
MSGNKAESVVPDLKSDGQVRECTAPTDDISTNALKSSTNFLNRELTWLQFNTRVLHEALDERNPLLERVKFASIAGSNLDEFFMKRIGGLKQQVGAGVQRITVDGRYPREQIDLCYAFIRDYHQQRDRLLARLFTELTKAGVTILGYKDLTEAERQVVRQEYYDSIFPLVTPQSIDPAHPFPFISNLSLNLLVTLRYPQDNSTSLARVKVPISTGAPRFVQIGNKLRFVMLEDLMANNLDMLFPGMEVINCELFRVTRNANTSRNEERAEDLLALIESTLQDRKFSPIVRLQVQPNMDRNHRGRLAAELGLNEETDVFEVNGMLGMRDLWQIAQLNLPQLKDQPHYPVEHPALLNKNNLFHVIRDAKAILLQHPYESFSSSVERFLLEAATDPKVRAIKMTLYRTSEQSPIVETLIRAAQNGKQVAVVVELQARFDEEANIRLANRMEEAGIHVTYGVVGLKTHCKVTLILRQDYKGLRRYVHIGTGNYHPETARLYSDVGLLLYDKDVGQDVTELFNYLTTGYTPKRNYKKLLPAPKHLKKALLDKIAREIERHKHDGGGHLIFKMNALDDSDISIALYQASRVGVKIDLIVRDSCIIRPGIEGLSETINVISIVGRFLEHSRIYYFRNGGEEDYLVGSADPMRRNLEHRVEVVVPVEEESLKQALKSVLNLQLSDQRNAWEMRSDGSYVQRQPGNKGDELGSQDFQIRQAEKRTQEASRLRKRKSRTFGKRNLR